MCDTGEKLYSQHPHPDWLSLDDLIMEKIFENLPLRDRYFASLVCRRWSQCFELAKVWRTVDINDQWPPTATRNVTERNYDDNSKQSLDYDRTTNCLQQIGQFMQNIHIRPSQHFVKLYQFFVLFEWYSMNQIRNGDSHPSTRYNNIRRLYFKFPCDRPIEEDVNGIKLFGVGGQLIGSFKKLLLTMEKLCDLTLVDLVLVTYEANSLMDSISIHLNRTLKKISCVNLTLNHCPIYQIGMLYNLEILKISPQNIDDSMLQALTDTNLMHLHILQNENTPKFVLPCSAKAWINFKKRVMTERPKIHLSAIDCDLLIQPEAPVYSITLEMSEANVMTKIIDNYYSNLVSFSDKGSSTCDKDMIEIISKCRKLSYLKISRPITTGALLTLLAIGDSLQEIRVPKSCVTIKFDEWILEFGRNNHLDTRWMQENFNSLDRVEYAISNYLSRSWHFSNK